METNIIKRLIISGLTPAITVDDITRRLGSFGSIIAADGFGLLDGLGQPRKFGFVTLETTPSKLGQCMNVLSGAVWKGTKLRLGEAKPDFKERILRENQDATEERPTKKRRVRGAILADDMSLVTPENATRRSGWHVSPLGRITYPMKMRPTHPLLTKQEEVARSNLTKRTKGAKRIRNLDTHARRKKIDMTKWGSTHLKGIFLDLEIPSLRNKSPDEVEFRKRLTEEEEVYMNIDDPEASGAHVVHSSPAFAPVSAADASREVTTSIHSSQDPRQQIDMHHEKVHDLDLITSLFNGNDRVDADWIGRESVGSDIDVEELIHSDQLLTCEEVGFEEVPRTQSRGGTIRLNPHTEEHDDSDTLEGGDAVSGLSTKPDEAILAKEPVTQTHLKDIFASREEAAFSLIDHLDLDIELNEDLEFLINRTSPVEPIALQEVPLNDRQIRTSQPRVVLDPKQALFFPLSSSDPGLTRSRQRDLYDVARENGWHWRDDAVRFWNVESEEETRKKWEENKGELTRDWKRRWREAGKFRKRKKLMDDDDQR